MQEIVANATMDCYGKCHFYMDVGRPKRLFILVNPFGGKKSATKIFVDTVQPLLEDAEIQFTLQGFNFRA